MQTLSELIMGIFIDRVCEVLGVLIIALVLVFVGLHFYETPWQRDARELLERIEKTRKRVQVLIEEECIAQAAKGYRFPECEPGNNVRAR
jgi:hypothetical protein